MHAAAELLQLLGFSHLDDLLEACADDLEMREAAYVVLLDMDEVRDDASLYGQLYVISEWIHRQNT